MSETNVYVAPDGRQVPIPAELAAKTKFTKAGVPDRRLKANAEFAAWADAVDKAMPNAKVEGAEADQWVTTAEALPQLAKWPVDAAQAYALRVWNGQNSDVPRNERLQRVAKALEGQGLSMEGVTLP